MSSVLFRLSAFGDEITPDLSGQLQLLSELNVSSLEFRSAWGKNVKNLDDHEVSLVASMCQQYGITISCIGSPVGKASIENPFEAEIDILRRIFYVAEKLGTRNIRIFSFYPPQGADKNAYLEESIRRLSTFAELAQKANMVLMLENDEGLIGDNIERCHTILSHINSPHLCFAWDGANFVASGVSAPTTNGWAKLGPYIGTAHIKDARAADHTKRAAGEGDAQIAELLQHLEADKFQGVLAVEPHPFIVDGQGELRGGAGMTYAVNALRKLLTTLQYTEDQTVRYLD